jgi:hypothetical protein
MLVLKLKVLKLILSYYQVSFNNNKKGGKMNFQLSMLFVINPFSEMYFFKINIILK